MKIFDVEVFAHDFIVVFKDYDSKEYSVFHNDYQGVNYYLQVYKDDIFVGFNNKHYDNYILKSICANLSPPEIKQVSDFIIETESQGWQHFLLRNVYMSINSCDLRDDMSEGLSLKAIEAHLGMPIEETEVDFTLDRPLTLEEIQSTIKYCKYDVDATEKLFDIRRNYLETKKEIGDMIGLHITKTLGLTNAKLDAKYLRASKYEHTDSREYVLPSNLVRDLIPYKIIDFFLQTNDLSITDEDLFKRKLTIELSGCKCEYAWGGVHGSLKKYHAKSTETRVIQNRDVASLYPNLMVLYDYLSRNVASKNIFKETLIERLEAKKSGNKKKANALKLLLNITSGAMENRYNDLYDPRQARSMRISGQLFLTELLMRILNVCDSFKLINFNTDGMMYEVDRAELSKLDKACSEWEESTGFELETDEIAETWIKDVNNLMFVDTKGNVKTVGGYLNYGISEKGAWSINNNYTIVKKAIIQLFANKIPLTTTINECNDPLEFQLIAKAGSKFQQPFWMVNDEKISTQRVNRVYASKSINHGTLYKTHRITGRIHKISELPDHCIIDNRNEITIDKIDKAWYVELAQKKVDDYLKGRKKLARKTEEKKMAKNVYQKLSDARFEFLSLGINKSGKHMSLTFTYFELEDIVPNATKIFNKLGLLPIVTFTNEQATMTIINCDLPEERIEFTSPMKEINVIVSNSGKAVTNEIQTLGAMQTYQRRYLYLIALDIVECDSIDPNTGNTATPEPKTKKAKEVPIVDEPKDKKAPATKQEKEQIKKELTTTNDNDLADEMLIRAVKNAWKRIVELRPESESKLREFELQTQAFTTLTKEQATTALTKLRALIDQIEVIK